MLNAVLIPPHILITQKEIGLLQRTVGKQTPTRGKRGRTPSGHQKAAGPVVQTMENPSPEPQRPIRLGLRRPQAQKLDHCAVPTLSDTSRKHGKSRRLHQVEIGRVLPE